ncbi:putative pyruvate, phosphate dikinase regulatory protein [Halobacillus andaensis]|uniref:Putative pyruvate, phosphate dikinase regulatory protein n=1 Tax=Halobacillus andaensis TaxID=1176239 RepID=A0A917B6M3_HALAA|nr:pyruvate, water dikinase regulatory protein [Halobacillus andaensis]MBP2006480.1 regulator of PEP synthase PpsR (kinase-PPPase family) [Halobacillus andaensis]GGF27677.1 putative pyruvate, phosphate dikinase regulatory protein [Halobacillus andaensis]
MSKKETVYVVSDSVGETADMMVKAVTSQFLGQDVDIKHFSYVENQQDINNVITVSKYTHSIIAYTIVLPTLKQYLDQRAEEEGIIAVDLMHPLMDAFTQKFNIEPNHQPGQMRKLDENYFKRVEAIEFAVKYDDGQEARGLKQADIVIVGVSRTSKTPLSMYLANKKFKVANVPLIPEIPPPQELFTIPRKKCVGLIITPEKLNSIRKERLKSLGLTTPANYASLNRILEELDSAEQIMKKIGCPIIDVSNKAIEETADVILAMFNKRGSFA